MGWRGDRTTESRIRLCWRATGAALSAKGAKALGRSSNLLGAAAHWLQAINSGGLGAEPPFQQGRVAGRERGRQCGVSEKNRLFIGCRLHLCGMFYVISTRGRSVPPMLASGWNKSHAALRSTDGMAFETRKATAPRPVVVSTVIHGLLRWWTSWSDFFPCSSRQITSL